MRFGILLVVLSGCSASSDVIAVGAGGPRQPSPVTALAFSPDGRVLLTGDPKGIVRIWDSQSGQLIRATVPAPAAAGVSGLVMSPDGSRVAILSGGEEVTVWPLQDGLPMRVIRAGHTIRTAAFLPDSSGLVTGGEGRRVELWDTTTGEARWMIDESSFPMRRVLVAPDGSTVVCLVHGGTLSFRDALDGSLRFTAPGFLPLTTSIGFFPDGRLVVSPGNYAWNLRTWKREPLDPWSIGTKKVWTSPTSTDITRVHRTIWRSTISRLDSSIAPILWDGHFDNGGIEGIAVTASLSRLAFGGADGIIRIVDVGSLEDRHGRFPGGAVQLALSPDGKHVAARAAEDKRVRLWHADRPSDSSWFSVPDAANLQLAFDAEGAFLRAACGGFFHEWSVRAEPYTVESQWFPNPKNAIPVAFSADGQFGWGILSKDKIRHQGPDGSYRTIAPAEPRLEVNRIVSSPDGRAALAFDSLAGKVLWIDSKGSREVPLAETLPARTQMALLANGRVAIFNRGKDGLDLGVEVYDLESNKSLHRLVPSEATRINAIAPFQTGTRFVLGDNTGHIYLCDAQSGLITSLQGHPGFKVLALAVSADGSTLVSSSTDESVLIQRLRP